MSGVADPSLSGRVAFCVSARTGLGHLRRVTNVAGRLRETAPGIQLCLVANAPFDGISESERALFSQSVVDRRADMARRLATMSLDAVVVDTAVVPDIELLPQRLALILRETIDARLASFRLPAGRNWDSVVVAEPEGGWTVDAGVIGADNVRNVGWISRRPAGDRALLASLHEQRVLLVAGGGGGETDGGGLRCEIDCILAEVRRLCAVPIRIVQVLGPRAPVHARLAHADAVLDVGPHLNEAFAEADAVVSTSGYNSILELAATSTPALLLSIPRTYDNQTARARHWAPKLGLAHERTEITRSAKWLARMLQNGSRRSRPDLGADGASAAAASICALVRNSRSACSLANFVKRIHAEGDEPASAVADRSTQLFAQGVPTLPGTLDGGGRHVSFARLEGRTARAIWSERRTIDPVETLTRPVICALAALSSADATGLGLQPLDPLRRIRPRLRRGGKPAIALGRRRSDEIAAFVAPLAAACAGHTGGRDARVVHGDFHLGQLIWPVGRDGYVIVDHDDLALGQPESDIGNLIAHIVTSPDLHDGPIAVGFYRLLQVIAGTYAEFFGTTPELAAVCQHGAIALVRRALKWLDNGGPTDVAEVMLAAATDVVECHEADSRSALSMMRDIRCA